MSMDERNTAASDEEVSGEGMTEKSREPLFGFLIMLVIAIFLLALASYGGWFLYRGVKESRIHSDRVSIESMPLGTGMEDKREEPKKTGEPKAEEVMPEKSDTPAVNKKIAIKVMNGGAEKGAASVAAGVLMGSGYSTVTTGNAAMDYAGITIFFKSPATEADANAVKSALIKKYPMGTVKASAANMPDTMTSPVTVIVGK